jgi:peptide/nickel transport system permease protein
MLNYILRRLAALVGLLLVLSAIIFVLQAVSPGDPVKAYLGANASPAAVAAERARLGLDDPLPVRYVRFLGDLVHGDLGQSFRTHRPVAVDLASYLPATVELVLASFALALVLASIFAISAALRWRGSSIYRGVLLVAATAPPFLLAIGGIVVFYSQLHLLPAAGRGDPTQPGDVLAHLVLPATVLAIAPAVSIGRILRSSLEATLGADFVRTARSKGLGDFSVLSKHVVRNSIGPALSMAGLQLGFMFAGVVIVEGIFSWPGIGNYLAASIPASDFPAIAGVTLVLGTIYIVSNAIVDLLQTAADPRIAA